jgi:hypothetical protein
MSKMSTRETMCATCPFRPESPHAYLARDLTQSALGQSSRICHSTGSNNAINRRTGKPPQLCRGARDIQLQVFHRLGFLSAATDEAWDAKCVELGLPTHEKTKARRTRTRSKT